MQKSQVVMDVGGDEKIAVQTGGKLSLVDLSILERILMKLHIRPAFVLGCLAFLLGLSYLFFGFLIPQTPGRMTRPSAGLIDNLPFWSWLHSLPILAPENAGTVAALIIVFSILVFVGYGIAISLVWRKNSHAEHASLVIVSSVTFFFLSVWFLPNFNTDIFNYILRGRVAAVHHSNPYYTAADEYPSDPLYEYASHRYTARPGGKFPGWMHLNVLLARLAGDDPVANLLLYRSFFFLVNVLNLVLIAAILRRLNPNYVLPAILTYAWNPIVVLNGQSKTDTVMVFYLLVSVWMLLGNRKKLAAIPLALSSAVKLITAPLAAVYILGDLRLKRWKAAGLELAIFVVSLLVIYLPFWQGPDIITQHFVAFGESGSSVPDVFRSACVVLFVLLTIIIGLKQDGSVAQLLRGWAFVLLFFSLFLTRLGFAWYLMTLIAVVSLTFNRRLTIVMVMLSFSSFLFNIWYSTFGSHFKVAELFALPKLIVYIALPGLTLISLAAVAGYRRFQNRRMLRHIVGQTDKEAASFDQTSTTETINGYGEDPHMLRVLTYHRVAEPKETPMLDPRIISSTPTVFAQHMEYLVKNHDVVSMAQVLEAIENEKRLPKDAILITFDDAYRDFRENAWPVLKRLGLPATLFVPTAFPDDITRFFWWDKLYRSVIHTDRSQIDSSPIGTLTIETTEERQQTLRRLQKYIKTLGHEVAMALVDEICTELGNGHYQGQTILSWDELRQLSQEGVTLGAHTRTHPIMTQLRPAQLREEIMGSFDDLKRETGQALPIFCFPNGSHNHDVVKILREENFKLAFTVIDGHNDLNTADPLRLRRTNITRRSTLPVFRLRLQRWFTLVDRWRHRERENVSHF